MSYSLQQAADATGKDRSTIQRAIKKGKISAALNESEAYQIDPAELHRVFPPALRNDSNTEALQQSAMSDATSENRELKARVELLREMVDDLRGRLDKSEEERREAQTKLTALLTHQPEHDTQTAPATEAEPIPKAAPVVRPAVWLAATVSLAAVAAWLLWLHYWSG